MDKKDIKAQAKSFVDKPRKERKSDKGQEAFEKLPIAVQKEVKTTLEARRGFARVNGVIQFTKEALEEQITRLETKYEDRKASLPVLKARIEELKDEYAERFGENNEK